MRRRAFTLIEILAVVAIISVFVATAVVGLNTGTDAARLRGASRDVFAAMRRARSTALVTQNPCVLSYSNAKVDGETCAKIEIVSAKMFGTASVTSAQTLSGETVSIGDGGEGTDGQTEAGEGQSAGGETMEEILFAPMSEDVVRGIAVKVLKEGEELAESDREAERQKPKISVFSNVDYLVGRYNEAKKEAAEKESEGSADDSGEKKDVAEPTEEDESPASVVWEVNGRCEPHKVWVYLAGKSPESGLLIKVDRFGSVKVVSEDDD